MIRRRDRLSSFKKKGRRKRRIRITSYLGVNSVVEWLGKCLIFSADLPAQFLSPLSGSYSRTSHGRWFIFPFRPFPLSCAVVQLWPSANNINSKRYCCGPMAGLVFKWNTCPFASSSHHHLLLFSFFPGDSGAGDRRGSSVPVVRRQLLRIPASPVEVSPFLKKKKQCRLNHFISLRSLSSSSNISRVTHTKESFPLCLLFFFW